MKKEYECCKCSRNLTGGEAKKKAKGFGDSCVLCEKCYDKNIVAHLIEECKSLKRFKSAKEAYRYVCDYDDHFCEDFNVSINKEANEITCWYDGEEHIKKVIKFDK